MISSGNEPLVVVLTPVFNGERYLSTCMESVLNQTYSNWEYIIVNNCSTDSTREIAARYADSDKRIRIHDNDEFVNVMRNHNIAFRLVSPESRYCKLLHADDWLFPDCLREMVSVGEDHPSVGVVGSYSLYDPYVKCDGLPFPSTVVSGRAVCRQTLLGKIYPFFSPTALLIRSTLVAQRERVYHEPHIYADVEALFEILQSTDFGFVHQVLTYIRNHDESVTSSFARRYNTLLFAELFLATRFGPVYLDGRELKACLKNVNGRYYEFLARSLFERRGKDFWRYHRSELERIGAPLSSARLFTKALLKLADVVLNPKRSVENAFRRVRYSHH